MSYLNYYNYNFGGLQFVIELCVTCVSQLHVLETLEFYQITTLSLKIA